MRVRRSDERIGVQSSERVGLLVIVLLGRRDVEGGCEGAGWTYRRVDGFAGRLWALNKRADAWFVSFAG